MRIGNSRGPGTLGDVERETGARPAELEDVVKDADVIVVTIPEAKVPNLPKDLFADVPANVVVIDTGNYYPRQRDGRIDGIEKRHDGKPLGRAADRAAGGEGVQQYLRGASAQQGRAGRARRDGSRCRSRATTAKAKAVVMKLVDEMGFDAVDAGTIDDSWRQQPATPVYTGDFDAAGVRAALQKADPVRKPEWRATDKSPGDFENPA